MKLFWLALSIGLFFYYFVVQALKVDLFSLEMLTHTLYYFLCGFIILAGWCFYKTEKHLKVFIILVFVILFIDDLYDYLRGINGLTTEMLIYNLYLLLWGSLAGSSFIAYWRRRWPRSD